MRETHGPTAERIHSIDVVRGLVMVLMAIDHVRVYAGVPAGSAEPATFFTRWVTHFCAPAFVFLAGTSAFLSGRRIGPAELGRKLLIRGAILILLELTLVRVCWTFNFDFGRYLLLGVLWMIGWCMILLAPLVRLPLPAIGGFGVLMIAGHNLNAFLPAESVQALLSGGFGWFFKILYFGGGIAAFSATPNVFVLYSLVPWIGVMAAGYAFGRVLSLERPARVRACLAIGLGSIAALLVLRGFNLYGDRPWSAGEEMPGVLAFLNTTKYPASLLFLLMTLGPMIAALPLLENAHGRVARWLAVFGRVPFAYYLLHIPLVHLLALGISLVRTPAATVWLFHDHPLRPGPVPEGYIWSLGLLYAVTALVVVVLYFPCRRFADLKAQRAHPLVELSVTRLTNRARVWREREKDSRRLEGPMPRLTSYLTRAFVILLLVTAFGPMPPLKAEAPPQDAGAPVQEPQPPKCCFANPGFSGTCEVEPAKDETCASILGYLNNPMSQGKSYCGNTTLRGGWTSVACVPKTTTAAGR